MEAPGIEPSKFGPALLALARTDSQSDGSEQSSRSVVEAPGIEPPPGSQSCGIVDVQKRSDSRDDAEVCGTPSTENARAMNACELEHAAPGAGCEFPREAPGTGPLEALSDEEVTDAVAALVRVGSYSVARVLLDELERRQAAARPTWCASINGPVKR